MLVLSGIPAENQGTLYHQITSRKPPLRVGQALCFKALATFDGRAIKAWAKNIIVREDTLRPNWVRYTLAKLNVVAIPLSTWNLKLVDIQRTS